MVNKIAAEGFSKDPVRFGALTFGDIYCRVGDKRDVAYMKIGIAEGIDLRNGRRCRPNAVEDVIRLSRVEIQGSLK